MFNLINHPIALPVLDRVRMAYANRKDRDPLQVIPETDMLLPEFRKLDKVPHCLSEKGVRLTMCKTAEQTSQECETWAMACGFFCGLSAYGFFPLEEIGNALDGTKARAEWDLQSERVGVGTALQGLSISTERALSCYTEGHAEAIALAKHIRKNTPAVVK